MLLILINQSKRIETNRATELVTKTVFQKSQRSGERASQADDPAGTKVLKLEHI